MAFNSFPIPSGSLLSFIQDLPVATDTEGAQVLGIQGGVLKRFPASLLVPPEPEPPTLIEFSGMATSTGSAGDPIVPELISYSITGDTNLRGFGASSKLSAGVVVGGDFEGVSVTAYFLEEYPTDTIAWFCLCLSGNLPKDYFTTLDDVGGSTGSLGVGPLTSATATYGYNDGSLESSTAGSTFWVWEVPYDSGYWYDGSSGSTIGEIYP